MQPGPSRFVSGASIGLVGILPRGRWRGRACELRGARIWAAGRAARRCSTFPVAEVSPVVDVRIFRLLGSAPSSMFGFSGCWGLPRRRCSTFPYVRADPMAMFIFFGSSNAFTAAMFNFSCGCKGRLPAMFNYFTRFKPRFGKVQLFQGFHCPRSRDVRLFHGFRLSRSRDVQLFHRFRTSFGQSQTIPAFQEGEMHKAEKRQPFYLQLW